MTRLRIISGRAHPDLALRVAELLAQRMHKGLDEIWCETDIRRFPDGEIYVHVKKTVRRKHVFVVQPTCPSELDGRPTSVNDNLMELLLLIDALKRASAEEIGAVIPYFGYARQDRKTEGRVPISAKVAANLIQDSGATRVLAMELHASQIQGFFDIPLDHLRTDHLFANHIKERHPDWIPNLVVASPDIGGVFRARRVAERLHRPLAVVAKRRDERKGELEVMHVIGDVAGMDVLIVDDIISTGSTLLRAAEALYKAGAQRVFAACTHGVFAGDALERLERSPLRALIVTDTIPQRRALEQSHKIEVISVAEELAEAIYRIYTGRSVSELLVRTR